MENLFQKLDKEVTGDYNGGNSKIYFSKDNANTWEYRGVE